MKKLTLILLSILMIVTLAACGNKCEHTYDNACDATCNECGETREVADHSFTTFTYTDHEHATACSICGVTNEETKEKHTLNAEFQCECGAAFRSKLTVNANVRTLFLYNQKDLLVKKLTYNFGEHAATIDYYYDENGTQLINYRYKPDGSLSYRSVYEYDAKGYLIKKTLLSAEDALLMYYIYENDENGNCIKETPYTPDGTYESYEVFEYDKNGNLSRREERLSDGSLSIYYLYAYDGEGNQTQRTLCYNEDLSKEILFYNKAGQITKIEYYSEDSLYFYTCYTYNEKGQEIKAIDYDDDGKLVRTCISDYYEDETRKSYIRYYGESNVIEDETLYYPNARRKSFKSYDKNGILHYFLEYDEQGNLTASSEQNQ